jgi:protein-S-isoprenylcysteine O-methyltransferase Ste14
MITPIVILNYLWAALGLYWLLCARHSGKSVTQEAPGWRVGRLTILVGTFILLLSPSLRIGLLAWRFVPQSEALGWFGVVLTAAGVTLCVRARLHLSTNWSDKVVLKAGHELIRTGPYAYLRHPIYSGVLLGIFGTALAIGEWRGVVALAAMSLNYLIKARREERILSAQFGDAYREYQHTAGFLLPRW